MAVAAGELPGKLALFSVILIVCGAILQYIIPQLSFVTVVGLLLLVIAYVYYSVNIFEVGGNYRILSILMLVIPSLPYFLLTSGYSLGAMIGTVIGSFLIWGLLIFVLHLVKQGIVKYILKKPEYSISPPEKTYVISSLMFFIVLGIYLASLRILHIF